MYNGKTYTITCTSCGVKWFDRNTYSLSTDVDATDDEIQKLIQPNTKAIFGETLTNPSLQVLDIEKFANIAHKNNIPLIIDNTFPTPILCKPIEFGADIVIHSTTKYMDGHALQVGGVIVDSGKFNWANGKFPEFTEVDDSYHGMIYTRDYPACPYIIKARAQLMRDFGCYPSAQSAFYLNLGIETLPVRMDRYFEKCRTEHSCRIFCPESIKRSMCLITGRLDFYRTNFIAS